MTDRGYTTRPVGSLSTADLLEEALQSCYDSGYYSGTDIASAHERAMKRRDQCFAEIKRRLEATRQLAYECRKLLDYRRRNTLNWQLEKADDFHRLIGLALDELEATDGN